MVGKRGTILGKKAKIDDFRFFGGIGQKIFGPRVFLMVRHSYFDDAGSNSVDRFSLRFFFVEL